MIVTRVRGSKGCIRRGTELVGGASNNFLGSIDPPDPTHLAIRLTKSRSFLLKSERRIDKRCIYYYFCQMKRVNAARTMKMGKRIKMKNKKSVLRNSVVNEVLTVSVGEPVCWHDAFRINFTRGADRLDFRAIQMHQLPIKWPPLFWLVCPPGFDRVSCTLFRNIPRPRDNTDTMVSYKFVCHFPCSIFLPALRACLLAGGIFCRFAMRSSKRVKV